MFFHYALKKLMQTHHATHKCTTGTYLSSSYTLKGITTLNLLPLYRPSHYLFVDLTNKKKKKI